MKRMMICVFAVLAVAFSAVAEDLYFCRGAMTSLIWMRGLSFDGE